MTMNRLLMMSVGKGLMDPIILRDKYRYISAVPGLTYPTMKLEINPNGSNVSLNVATEIDRFCHHWFILINSNVSFVKTQYEGHTGRNTLLRMARASRFRI